MISYHKSSKGVVAVLLAASSSAGCASIEWQSPIVEWRSPLARREAPPRLRVAADPQITLFGEISGVATAAYSPASSSVMRYQHTRPTEGADFDVDVGPLGRKIVFASTRHSIQPNLYVQSVFGTAVMQLTGDPSSDAQPAFSPDGSRVAFSSNRSGGWDIWIVGVDGAPPVRVTDDPGDELHPSWSPDGTELVYCRRPPSGGQWELWITSVASGGRHRFIGYGLFPEWSPQGETLVYQRARQRGSHWFSIWTTELVDGEPSYPTEIASSGEGAFIVPTWSPDGTRIAFGAVPAPPRDDSRRVPESDRSDVWIVDHDGGHRFRLTNGQGVSFSPVWSVSGRIFFTSRIGGVESIWSTMPGVTQPMRDSGIGDVILSRRIESAGVNEMVVHPAGGA